MALNVGELFVTIGADSTKLTSGLRAAESQFRSFGRSLSAQGRLLTAAVTAPFAALGVYSTTAAASLEQVTMAFTTLTGSAASANELIRQMRDFAKKTPFEFTGLTQNARLLMAFGFTAQEVIPMLTNIGDAVSAMGGNTMVIDNVVRALGQMKAKTAVSAEEMMQLTEAGIPAWQMLSDAMGKSVAEIMKMSEQKLIPAATAVPAILEGMNRRYGGMMDTQSKTTAGRFSNLKDAIAQTAQDIGSAFLPVVNKLLEIVTPMLPKLQEWGRVLAEDVSKGIRTVATVGQDLYDRVSAWIDKHGDLATKFAEVAAVCGPFAWGLGKIIPLASMLSTASRFAWLAVLKLGGGIWSLAKFISSLNAASMMQGIIAIPSLFSQLWTWLMKLIGPMWDTVKAFYALAKAEGLWATIQAAILPGAAVGFAAQLAVAGAAVFTLFKAFDLLGDKASDWMDAGKGKLKDYMGWLGKLGDEQAKAFNPPGVESPTKNPAAALLGQPTPPEPESLFPKGSKAGKEAETAKAASNLSNFVGSLAGMADIASILQIIKSGTLVPANSPEAQRLFGMGGAIKGPVTTWRSEAGQEYLQAGKGATLNNEYLRRIEELLRQQRDSGMKPVVEATA